MGAELARLSIIIPALNEAEGIQQFLTALKPLRDSGHELILVDGGSRDDTAEIAEPLVDRLFTSPPGRALQMNRGATAATGDTLLFLHADTRLPDMADRLIIDALNRDGRCWGRFDVRLGGHSPLLRLVELMMNLRSRLSGIATGDQAIFITRQAFAKAGRFPSIPLMEDIALSRALKRFGRPACLDAKVTTSSRRWENGGIVHTILLMWWLRLAYFLGVSPNRLARLYHD